MGVSFKICPNVGVVWLEYDYGQYILSAFDASFVSLRHYKMI